MGRDTTIGCSPKPQFLRLESAFESSSAMSPFPATLGIYPLRNCYLSNFSFLESKLELLSSAPALERRSEVRDKKTPCKKLPVIHPCTSKRTLPKGIAI